MTLIPKASPPNRASARHCSVLPRINILTSRYIGNIRTKAVIP